MPKPRCYVESGGEPKAPDSIAHCPDFSPKYNRRPKSIQPRRSLIAMSVVKKKTQLDFVLKAHHGAIGQNIEQKDRHDDVFKTYSCFKEFETADFETQNPEMKFSIQHDTYFTPSNTSPLSGKIRKVKEPGLKLLQPAEGSLSNFFDQLTESHLAVAGRAKELCSCPQAPEYRN
ncbi:hypothetical protein ACSAZL_09510 [Methanosarcina sp. T3]|uniref:hypothetical protein n=1 Tax=Methanosarcina sp. T3 TaxID=3439062 RepID=UPI003F87E1CC